MSRIEEYTKGALERIEKLEHQRSMKKYREDEQKRKDDIRRYIIIGKMICRHFPDMMKYQPKHSDAENAEEFSDLEIVFSFVAEQTEFLEAVKKKMEGAG